MQFTTLATALAAFTLLTTALAQTTTTTVSRRPLSKLTTTTTTSAFYSPTATPPTFALGTVYSRGSYSTNYIIWSPTFNTTASQCNSPASIAGTSAYSGPNHAYCDYPFDFDGYTGLTLTCAGQYPSFETGVTGIALSNGTQLWTCSSTPLSNPYGGYTAVQPYHCPLPGVYYDYLPIVSLLYICQ